MLDTNKNTVLVVVQLSGGNDYLNCVIPYTDPLYRDYRPNIGIPIERILRLDDQYGLNPGMGPMKKLYDQGKVAIIHGVGYSNPNRSHFRSMDIWHTCEPDKIASEGWLGKAIRDMDPGKENVLTGVNFGRGLPRALACPGVPVASVGNLETYGLLRGISAEIQREEALMTFSRMYTPAVGSGWVMDYLKKTGTDALKGADILSTAPKKYSSTVEYAFNPIAQQLKGVAQVLFAGFGTRVLYTQHGGFDTHANEVPIQEKLWNEVSSAIYDFYQDLDEHNATDNVVILVFSEFGRRVRDNGTGTDHGIGGVSFLIGDQVKGGMFSEYPSLDPGKLLEDDLAFSIDFRGIYSEILEGWMNLDASSIVGGTFEQPNILTI